MEPIHKKFLDGLIEAEKAVYSSDHMVNVVYPVVKDGKVLLRALEQVNIALRKAISNILKYEYMYKRIELSDKSEKNLETFFKRCSGKYGLDSTDEERAKEILILGKEHKESGFEFTKQGKVIILDDSGEELKASKISAEKIKEFIELVKRVLVNARKVFTNSVLKE